MQRPCIPVVLGRNAVRVFTRMRGGRSGFNGLGDALDWAIVALEIGVHSR
ncbi:MAG: hypothetical protein JWP34_4629 [Massilia sp.]|nr:hypothetical protein [Massilia sp.]